MSDEGPSTEANAFTYLWRYTRGDGVALLNRRLAVMLPGDVPAPLLLALSERLIPDGTVDDALSLLAPARGSLPFALLERGGAGGRLLLAGPLVARTPSGDLAGGEPYAEHDVPPGRVVIAFSSERLAIDPADCWPCDLGVVWTKGLVVMLAAPTPDALVRPSRSDGHSGPTEAVTPQAVRTAEDDPVEVGEQPDRSAARTLISGWTKEQPVAATGAFTTGATGSTSQLVPSTEKVQPVEVVEVVGQVEHPRSIESVWPEVRSLELGPRAGGPSSGTPTLIDHVPGVSLGWQRPDDAKREASIPADQQPSRPMPTSRVPSSEVRNDPAPPRSGFDLTEAGRTRLRSQLPMSPTPLGTTFVAAITCPRGHLSAPTDPQCRVCGAPVESSAVTTVERPPLARIPIPGQSPVLLDRDIILGREPGSAASMSGRPPKLVTISDPEGHPEGSAISRTHLSLVLDDWHILATDLGSSNGTDIVHRNGRRQQLVPHQPVAVQPGSVIVLAGVVELHVEPFGA